MSSPSAAPALRLTDVTVGYGRHAVLHGLSLTVEPGELVGLVGPSGAGKTTVLRALTGTADRHAGQIEVLGRPVPRRRPPEGIGIVPQIDHVDWDFPLTVEQVVLLGRAASSAPRPWFSRRERRQAHEVLERLGLADLAARRISALSGGQRQRMMLARALLHDARLLLLDEPTSGVDVATRREVLGLLDELRRDGLTVLLTTHDLNQVAALLPRVICLNGAVTGDGPPAAVLTPAVLEATFGAPLRVLYDHGRVVVVDEVPAAATGLAAVSPLGARRDGGACEADGLDALDWAASR